jgi:hypothetical protein
MADPDDEKADQQVGPDKPPRDPQPKVGLADRPG